MPQISMSQVLRNFLEKIATSALFIERFKIEVGKTLFVSEWSYQGCLNELGYFPSKLNLLSGVIM